MLKLTQVTADEWAEALLGVRTYAREGKHEQYCTMEHVEHSTGGVRGRVIYSIPRVYEVYLEAK